MRVALTGVSGFVGRHLAERLVADGHDVVSLGRTEPADARIEHRFYDLSQMAPPPLDEGLDAVVHLAAVIDVDDPARPDQLVANVGASWALARWSRERGVRHLHASTGGVYGCGPRPFTESDRHAPVDSYSITKALAETAVAAVNGDAVLVRYFFPYGPGTPNPIPSMLAGLKEGRPIRVRQDGGPRLNPIHIDDAVELTVRLLEHEFTGPVNIAGFETTSFAELGTLGARLLSTPISCITVEANDLHPYYRSDIVADISRAVTTVGPLDFTTLAEGIGALLNDSPALRGRPESQ